MYLFEYVGAVFLWIFESVFYTKKPAFKDVLTGKERYSKGDLVDRSAYGIKLKFIGFVVTMVIVSLLAKV